MPAARIPFVASPPGGGPGRPERERTASERFTREYAVGTVLFEEGQAGDRMYVLHAGRVRIVKRVGTHEVVLATLGPGEFFGEMAVLDGEPRSAAAVVAAKGTVLVELDRPTFEQLVRDNGEIALRLLRRLAARLRDSTRQVTAFLTDSGSARCLEVLQGLAGSESDGGWRPLPDFFDVALLATRAGLSLTEARQVLSHLEAACLVTDRGGRLHLAPGAEVGDYRSYLGLKGRYDPLTVRELSEMTGMPEAEVHRTVKRLLAAKLEEAVDGRTLVDTYRRYLLLKRRFEYPEATPRDGRAGRARRRDDERAGFGRAALDARGERGR